MNLAPRVIPVVLGLCLLVPGCGGSVKRLDKRIDRLEREISDVRKLHAEQVAEMSAVNRRVRMLAGQLETLQYTQKRTLGGGLQNIQQDLADIRRRVPPPPIVPVEELEQDERELADLPEQSRWFFQNALERLRLGSYGNALKNLEELRLQSIGREHEPLVMFWIGVANDGLGDNRAALAAYHDLATRFSKHPRAPLALLRQASVFIRLQDSATAELTLKKLIAQYPGTPAAQQAKSKLKDF